jgi:hypothetical protein
LLSIWLLLVAAEVAVNHLQMLAEAEAALEVYLLDMLVLHLALLTRLLLAQAVLVERLVKIMVYRGQTQSLALSLLLVVVLVLLGMQPLAPVALVEGRALALRLFPVLEFLVKVTLVVARLRQIVQAAAAEVRVLSV